MGVRQLKIDELGSVWITHYDNPASTENGFSAGRVEQRVLRGVSLLPD